MEDRELKERLELSVARLSDPAGSVVSLALELLRKEIREATSSLTSVPKPLKYLAPHYVRLRKVWAGWGESPNGGPFVEGGGGAPGALRKILADILSVLALTLGTEPVESLRFKRAGNWDDLEPWGSTYIRSLAGEIGVEWQARLEGKPAPAPPATTPAPQVPGVPGAGSPDELLPLIKLVVPYNMAHNAEVEVCVGGGGRVGCARARNGCNVSLA